MALKPEVFFPINSSSREEDGFGTGKVSGNLTFILEQRVPFGSVLFNAVLGRNRIHGTFDDPDATVSRLSIAPIWEDMGQRFARGSGTTVIEKYAEFGVIYSPGKDLDLALGIIGSSDNQDPRTTTRAATVGVTWRFQ